MAFRGQERGERAEVVLGEIAANLRPHLNFSPRKFVTFITRGFPYGFFWQDSPSTHLFSQGSDNSIASSIYGTASNRELVSAVVIDPGHIPNSETAEVTEKLRSWGTFVVVLHDSDATVQNVRLFLHAFPSDLFFVCGHCGAVGGQRIQVRIVCHDDKEHLFEVDTAVNIVSDIRDVEGTEMVQVSEFFRPISMDGEQWSGVASNFKADWSRFLEGKNDIWERVVQRSAIDSVQHTTAIKLANGHFVLISLNAFDTSVSPIFFNNTCVSFFDAANQLTAAGAQSYIGTLAPVPNDMARQFAIEVFKSEESLTSLPLAIHSVQSRLWSDRNDRIYVHIGCHFSRFVPPSSRNSARNLAHRIALSKNRWKEYVGRPRVPGRETAEEYIEFLSSCENMIADSQQRPREGFG